jgi:hypothetical protein
LVPGSVSRQQLQQAYTLDQVIKAWGPLHGCCLLSTCSCCCVLNRACDIMVVVT